MLILIACTAQPVINNYYEYNTYPQAAPADTGFSDDSADHDSAATDTASDTAIIDTATDTTTEEPSLADRVCASSIMNEFTTVPDPYADPQIDGYADYLYCYGYGYEPNVGPAESGIYSVWPGCYWTTEVSYGTPCPSGGCIQFSQTLNVKYELTLTISAERVTFDLCDVRSDTFDIAGYRVVDGTTEFSQLVTVASPGEVMCGEVSADFEESVTQLLMFEDSTDTDTYAIDNLLFEWDCE